MGIDNKFGHAFTLMNNLSDMRYDSSTCDFTIKVETKIFNAHRLVLAACSDFFKAMTSSAMKESSEGSCDLKGVGAEAFKIFLDYTYTGKVAVTPKNYCDVLSLSDMLQCNEMKDLCVQFLEDNVCVENCLRVKFIAEDLGLTMLANHAELYSIEQFEDVITTEDFQALDVDEFLKYLISSGEVTRIRWEGLMYWIRADEDREEFLPDMLRLFDAENCTFRFLYKTAWSEPLVQGIGACKITVARALLCSIQRRNLTVKNCFKLLEIAQRYGVEKECDAIDTIQAFMAGRIETITKNPEFDLINKDIIQGTYRNISSWNSQNWAAILKWVKFDQQHRKKQLYSILDTNNNMSATFAFAYGTMFAEPLIRNSKRLAGVVAFFVLRVMEPSDINFSNWYQLLQLLRICKVTESDSGMKNIFNFMENNLEKLSTHENFVNITKDELIRLLHGIDIGLQRLVKVNDTWKVTNTSTETWDAIISWIGHDEATRLSCLKDILATIRLKKFGFRYLFEKILQDPVTNASPASEKIVVSALFSALAFHHITPDNCFHLLRLARQYSIENATEVISEIREFLEISFKKISGMKDFLSLPHNDILYLMESPNVQCSEKVKWETFLKWVKSDSANRKSSLPDLLRELKLKKLSHDYIRNHIYAESLVKNCEECESIIAEALRRADPTTAQVSRDEETVPSLLLSRNSRTM